MPLSTRKLPSAFLPKFILNINRPRGRGRFKEPIFLKIITVIASILQTITAPKQLKQLDSGFFGIGFSYLGVEFLLNTSTCEVPDSFWLQLQVNPRAKA